MEPTAAHSLVGLTYARAVTRSRQRAIAVASLVAAIAFLFAPTAAQAHSELVGSTPAADATLNKPPTQISLEFNEGVQQQGGAIVVYGSRWRSLRRRQLISCIRNRGHG